MVYDNMVHDDKNWGLLRSVNFQFSCILLAKALVIIHDFKILYQLLYTFPYSKISSFLGPTKDI